MSHRERILQVVAEADRREAGADQLTLQQTAEPWYARSAPTVSFNDS